MASWILENWFEIESIPEIIVGGFFIFMKHRKSVQSRRAESLKQNMEKLCFDEQTVKGLHIINYEQDWYNRTFHESGNLKFLIDKALSYLSYECYLIEIHYITKKESLTFDYDLRRACESRSVQSYLFNLYHFSKTKCSFQYLIDYGFKHNIIDKDFLDCKSFKYPHYLIGNPLDEQILIRFEEPTSAVG
ncbi:MAG: hypothetical protein LBM20_00555 [Rikenellaceae bacterium]|jgi:hypothetical protein|nr:hypothetical protein [Rikenellaceae bacterium]